MLASSWSDLLSGLVPFVLLIAFWGFLMRRTKDSQIDREQPLIDKLEEIRVELERLRKSIEGR